MIANKYYLLKGCESESVRVGEVIDSLKSV